jgi:hypothetical protein
MTQSKMVQLGTGRRDTVIEDMIRNWKIVGRGETGDILPIDSLRKERMLY